MTTRKHRIPVRLTAEERDTIKAAAAAAGLDMASFLRLTALKAARGQGND